jgi:sterol desaturase/sphingolipid hydroxylase (fatty acid hydroxylase superfamily)
MEQAISNLPPIVLLLAFAGFWIWEAIGSARSNSRDWGRRGRNLFISAVGIAIGGFASAAMLTLSSLASDFRWGLAGVPFLPAWAVAALGVLLLDLTDYWRHRISHRIPVLWLLHRLHHSDPRIDVTTSLRSHPLEFLLRPLFLGPAIAVFGIPVLPLLLYPVLQLPVLVFQHANIRLPSALDGMLAWVMVTPAMHLVHHSRARPETDSNYSTFLSIWDRVFGSWKPSVPPVALGLDELDDDASQRILGMLSQPWREGAALSSPDPRRQ